MLSVVFCPQKFVQPSTIDFLLLIIDGLWFNNFVQRSIVVCCPLSVVHDRGMVFAIVRAEHKGETPLCSLKAK